MPKVFIVSTAIPKLTVRLPKRYDKEELLTNGEFNGTRFASSGKHTMTSEGA